MLDARKVGNAYRAKCPAHADTSPSLQIRQGDRGLLLKCWSGCTFEQICVALQIKPRDLFFDGTCPGQYDLRKKKRVAMVRKMERFAKIDSYREADITIMHATGIDISGWTNDQIDAALDAVCKARGVLEGEDVERYP